MGDHPQTVNAYYARTRNEIVVPAAILRPPFFDPGAEDAVNYGAIGAVIGHEICHGFDAQGRKYDAEGRLRDWWTAADDAEYRRKAALLIQQYDAYEPLPGHRVNGTLTLGENIADLIGLRAAHRAYHLALAGAPSPVLDGFTGDQRLFVAWARIWARKYREDDLVHRLATDPHTPGAYRANGPPPTSTPSTPRSGWGPATGSTGRRRSGSARAPSEHGTRPGPNLPDSDAGRALKSRCHNSLLLSRSEMGHGFAPRCSISFQIASDTERVRMRRAATTAW